MSIASDFARLYDARDSWKNSMLIGAAICAAGGLLTWVSYAAALPGSTYYVWTGAILFGGYRFLRGAYRYFDCISVIKRHKKFYDDLQRNAELLARMMGYPSYNDLEAKACEQLGQVIDPNGDINVRLHLFAKMLGHKSFEALFK